MTGPTMSKIFIMKRPPIEFDIAYYYKPHTFQFQGFLKKQGRPGKIPGRRGYFTTCALMRLVVPLLLRGTPAVITTVSPGWTSPSFLAVSAHRENRRSVESTFPDRKGTTP